MDYKLRLIFLFFFIHYSYNFVKEPIQYKINIIDNEMQSNHILVVNNKEDGYLYIITGEDKKNVGTNLYKRYILKYDENSGNFDKYFYNSTYPFKNPESTIAGFFSEFLLITTEKSISIYNETYLEEESFNRSSSRITLKNNGVEYYYIYTKNDDKNDLIIAKLKLVIQAKINGNPFYNIIKTSEPLSIISHQEMISCDLTNDNQYILCAYISQDKSFTISVHNKYLELIQVSKKEVCQNFDTSYFIKIIYFKDNSKFITMNSENDYITRLRYFKYNDKNFINQLYSLLNNNDQYLDVDETQQVGYNYNMDAIAVHSDKIIKVFASNDQIIITVFQFYEHETLLFIKIYNMKGFDYAGYNYLLNPRISMFRESFVICLSTYYNNGQRAGYFFINYPNSNDFNLSSNNAIIKIKDLVSIENNLFSFDLKFKVLNVPKDFIFINLNGTVIKEGDILELNDELILRQFRIKKGPYKLKYEGIAIGNDLQYSSSKVYPIDREIPITSETIIEGKESNIVINLDDCLEGYYHLDKDYNICTNIKPKGYYIDEEKKIYKECESPCEECSGPKINRTNMNCITCIKGYNITYDTKSCYDHLPEQYYLDNDTFKKCYERCNRCFNGSNDSEHMNCLSCISNDFFFRKDSFNCILRNETTMTSVIVIKSSFFLYLLFVSILLFSVIISCIFLFTCSKPEHNQGNDYKENTDVKANKSGKVPAKIKREIIDINEQIKGPINGNELSLLNNRNSINNEE